MRAFRISIPFLLLIVGMGFSLILGDTVKGTPAASEVAATQPTASQTLIDADAIPMARRAMLKALDEQIASLRALLIQLPEDQRPQSGTNRRLQEALAEKASVETAPDSEIVARFTSIRAASSSKPTPSPENVPVRRRGTATTKPVVSGLETQLVFPGSASQGQVGAQLQPTTGCEVLTLHGLNGTTIVALFGRGVISRRAASRPTLLYFYGNGTCMANSLNVFNRLRGLGFDVIMADYEGYGMSDGTPSELGCYAAADAVYDYLLKRNDVDHDHIVATGWSLGAAVAIDLASRRRLAGVATFSAFTNISDMSGTMTKGFPLAMVLLSSWFDNLAKIGSISCPIFMAHGTNDSLVPPEMLDRLSASAKTKVTIVHVDRAEHNDIFQQGGNFLYNRLRVFVDGLPAVSPTTMPN